MTLGERIISCRAAKRMTQQDLAEAVSVSRQAVSKWETDSSVPELDKLIQLCEILDTSMDYLTRGIETSGEHLQGGDSCPAEGSHSQTGTASCCRTSFSAYWISEFYLFHPFWNKNGHVQFHLCAAVFHLRSTLLPDQTPNSILVRVDRLLQCGIISLIFYHYFLAAGVHDVPFSEGTELYPADLGLGACALLSCPAGCNSVLFSQCRNPLHKIPLLCTSRQLGTVSRHADCAHDIHRGCLLVVVYPCNRWYQLHTAPNSFRVYLSFYSIQKAEQAGSMSRLFLFCHIVK